MSHEETLAIRKKFLRVGWRSPNHEDKTKKVVTRGKRFWDWYLTAGDPYVVSRYV